MATPPEGVDCEKEWGNVYSIPDDGRACACRFCPRGGFLRQAESEGRTRDPQDRHQGWATLRIDSGTGNSRLREWSLQVLRRWRRVRRDPVRIHRRAHEPRVSWLQRGGREGGQRIVHRLLWGHQVLYGCLQGENQTLKSSARS